MRIALFQPDIPQNTGTILRLCACLGVSADIIEPAGFPLGDRAFRRAGMDYVQHVDLVRHTSFAAFQAWRAAHETPRLVLATTKTDMIYTKFIYQAGDILLFGRESTGAPEEVHGACDARVTIPMAPGMRSINVALAVAMVLAEALRQTQLWPDSGASSLEPA